jgi:hypothetical protein
MFPKKAVGSVVGIGGMAGSAYVLTLFIFHLLVAKSDIVDMELK